MARRTRPVITCVSLCALVACGEAPRPLSIQPTYDQNGKLRLLTYDSKGGGRPDTWAYMDGSRVVRVESDTARTGKVDQWEYYDAARGDQPVRVELATNHDGRVTRREFYDRGVMVRAEEDTAGRGRPDKWETYADGRLTTVAFDTTGAGQPTRHIDYSATVAVAQATPQGVATANAQGLTVSGKVLRDNQSVPNVPLRCRNLDTNAIVGYSTSDRQGAYTFTVPAPGRYIVEALKDDGSVFAVGSAINVTGAAAIIGANVILAGSKVALVLLGAVGSAIAVGIAGVELGNKPPSSPER